MKAYSRKDIKLEVTKNIMDQVKQWFSTLFMISDISKMAKKSKPIQYI